MSCPQSPRLTASSCCQHPSPQNNIPILCCRLSTRLGAWPHNRCAVIIMQNEWVTGNWCQPSLWRGCSEKRAKAAREDHGPPPWALGQEMNCSCLNSPLSLCFPLWIFYIKLRCQHCPIELSAVMDTADGNVLYLVISCMVAPSHIQIVSTWSVARVNKELEIILFNLIYINFHRTWGLPYWIVQLHPFDPHRGLRLEVKRPSLHCGLLCCLSLVSLTYKIRGLDSMTLNSFQIKKSWESKTGSEEKEKDSGSSWY